MWAYEAFVPKTDRMGNSKMISKFEDSFPRKTIMGSVR